MSDICPNCGKHMQYDIQLEYDHSPYYCVPCGYAEGCSNEFSEENCNKCTEYAYCKRWYDIKNTDDNNISKCRYCGKKCTEIQEYIDMALVEETTPEQFVKTDGTYDRRSNTFICTSCYVKTLI